MKASTPSFKNSCELLQKIDCLPSGPAWVREIIKVKGDAYDEKGKEMTEEFEMWKRDPVECIRELLGNPDFHGNIAYAPERVYQDCERKVQVWDEMWTGSWWWETQVRCHIGYNAR